LGHHGISVNFKTITNHDAPIVLASSRFSRTLSSFYVHLEEVNFRRV